LDVAADLDRLSDFIAPLAEAGCRVSLFVAADERQLQASAQAGAAVVELHTGAYCDFHAAGNHLAAEEELLRIARSVRFAAELGLEVHAGHGLSYETVSPIAALPEVAELNIGHFLIGESVFLGLGPAIAEMRRLMQNARR
jgi:pyridoxine 5-phosphate synthase